MTTFLKNYTSESPVAKSIDRIEEVLIKCGVSGITKEYGPNAVVTAITFKIKFDDLSVSVRLPADKDKAQQSLWLNYANGDKLSDDGQRLKWSPLKKKTRADFAEQADRTAWAIVRDWVEIQMSMIQLKQAAFDQVFLPYIWDGTQTFYQQVKGNGYLALQASAQQKQIELPEQ